MHEKIVEYRTTKKITIKEFLLHCGLPPNKSYYQQLCSSGGNNIHPSNKSGSPGKIFMDAVTTFFEIDESGRPSPRLEKNIDAEVCDLNLEHGDELRGLGVCGLSFDSDARKMMVNCFASADEEIVRNHLGQKIDMNNVVTEFRRIELLYMPPPYVLKIDVDDSSKFGTTTPLNLTGALVAITCAHCVGQVDSTVCKISKNDCTDVQEDFGKVQYLDKDLDLAFIYPNPGNKHCVFVRRVLRS